MIHWGEAQKQAVRLRVSPVGAEMVGAFVERVLRFLGAMGKYGRGR